MNLNYWRTRWSEIKTKHSTQDQPCVLLRALQRDPYAQDEACTKLAEIIRGYLADEAIDAFRIRRGEDPHYPSPRERIDHALAMASVAAALAPDDDI